AALQLKEVRSEPSASVASVQAPTVESRSTPARPPDPVRAANPPSTPSPQPGTLLARATLEETPSVVARHLLPSARNVPPAASESVAPPAPRRRRRTGVQGAEAVVEGFFVARIAGRQEAERHDLTDTHAGSPSAYSQGMSAPTFRRIVLLPRDPRTLFVFFDLATSGIELREGERVVVRIFDDGQAIRQLAAEQISRGFYVDGLQSLRSYYAEAWALGPQGERFLGPSSNAVSLPGVGAPAERVRFLKVPWTLPLPRLRDLARSGQVRLAERDGEVRVGMRHAVWHQEGPHAWDPSMSGQGRWEVVSEEAAHQQQIIERDVEYPAGDSLRDGLPTSSGAGRPSSFTLVRPK
ncbi:MAG: DUF4912 domain-containing protein, partial [Myxococcota bacterium]|nr:DUF4912 domain-containing protein [Myxococcota bacterium]